MKISDLITDDTTRKMELNCAESILFASNETMDLGLDKKARLLASGFGGGLGIGNVCGALTGGIMVLGRLYVKDHAHEGTRIKDVEKELIAAFEKEYGTLMCTPIKDKHSHPELRCKSVIVKAAEILEEVIRNNPPESSSPVQGG